MTREALRVVVIGGGLAGAATAWGLSRRGHKVTLLEQADRPGVHASGRNAGLIRRVIGDPAVAALAREGADLLAEPPDDLAAALSADLVRPTGSIMIAGEAGAPALRRAANDARAAGVDCKLRRPERVVGELLGIAAPDERGVAVVTPADGIADPHAVLSALLDSAREAGAEIVCERVARIRTRGTGAAAVETDQADYPADLVVNAAGPWASDLVTAAGGLDLRLLAYRRHLYYTGPLPEVDPAAPWVWDVERGFYVRPESSGLLLCACDADLRPAEDTEPLPNADALLAEKVGAVAPELSDLPLARTWAGLRTFADDERFVIGWDPTLRGLFWVAALGGHGLTTACAVGLLAAEALEGQADTRLRAFDPARLTRTSGRLQPARS